MDQPPEVASVTVTPLLLMQMSVADQLGDRLACEIIVGVEEAFDAALRDEAFPAVGVDGLETVERLHGEEHFEACPGILRESFLQVRHAAQRGELVEHHQDLVPAGALAVFHRRAFGVVLWSEMGFFHLLGRQADDHAQPAIVEGFYETERQAEIEANAGGTGLQLFEAKG